MILVNLIQYEGTVGVFNNRRFANSSLIYSYFSKKYHNYDTFTLAVGLIILTFWHLINILSNWKFMLSISSRPCWYLQFLKEDPILKIPFLLLLQLNGRRLAKISENQKVLIYLKNAF